MSWVSDSQAPSLSNQPLLKPFDLICIKDLLQMLYTKQNNSKISEDISELEKLILLQRQDHVKANEADKHSQSTPLGITKFVNGVDSYDNIVDQKSK